MERRPLSDYYNFGVALVLALMLFGSVALVALAILDKLFLR